MFAAGVLSLGYRLAPPCPPTEVSEFEGVSEVGLVVVCGAEDILQVCCCLLGLLLIFRCSVLIRDDAVKLEDWFSRLHTGLTYMYCISG